MNDIKFDPYDPACLRLDQSFCDCTAVRKLLTTVPVRKPNRQDFFRRHPMKRTDFYLRPSSSSGMTGRCIWLSRL